MAVAGWSGGHDVGAATATLRTNAPGATPPPFTLFNVDTRMAPSPGGEVRVGVALGSRFTIEGGALLARQELAFQDYRRSGEQRAAVPTAKPCIITSSTPACVGVAGSSRPTAADICRRRRRVLRQLHQDRTLVEQDRSTMWAVVLDIAARRPESARSLGLRGDFRLNLRHNGVDFENKNRVYPAVSLLMFVGL